MPRGQSTATLDSRLAGGANFSNLMLRDSVANSQPLEARLAKMQGRFEAGTGSDSLKARIGAGANSSVQQRFTKLGGGPRGFAKNLEQTSRRAKARQGILNRGDKHVENQQLKDRISIARQKIQRKGVVEAGLGNAARLRSGEKIVADASNAQVTNAFVGMAGSVAGGALSGFLGRDKPVTDDFNIDSLAAGTGAADFQIGNPSGFNFDIDDGFGGVGFA